MAAIGVTSPFDIHRTTSAIFRSANAGHGEKDDLREEDEECSSTSRRTTKRAARRTSELLRDSRESVGLGDKRRKRRRVTSATPAITGALAQLPEELLEIILLGCGAKELGCLTATCTYFTRSGIAERTANKLIQCIPHDGSYMKPGPGESWTRLLHFLTSCNQAREQVKGVSMGAYHTTIMGVGAAAPPPAVEEGTEEECRGSSGGSDAEVALVAASSSAPAVYTFGRGFHGQLGVGDYEHRLSPVAVRLLAPPPPTASEEGGSGVPADTAAERDALGGSQPPKGAIPVEPALVSCGNSHSCVVGRGGELMTWGLASSGELGHGGWTPIELCVPRQVAALRAVRVTQVSTGANHTLAVGACGGLWSSGRGRMGQLGHGLLHDAGPLQRVDSLRGLRVVEAAAGGAHSMARVADGAVYAWGDARHGQLGLGDVAEPTVAWPRRVDALPAAVTQLVCGGAHSLALTSDGVLFTFGRGRHGALGLGDTVDRRVPTVVPVRLSAVLAEAYAHQRGGACGGGGGPLSARGVGRGHSARSARHGNECRVVQVAAGANHTLALVHRVGSAGLEVYSAGCNGYGQLGHGDTKERVFLAPVRGIPPGSRVRAVATGQDHSGAVCADGSVWLWGRGDWGQLGLGDQRSRWLPALHPGLAASSVTVEEVDAQAQQ